MVQHLATRIQSAVRFPGRILPQILLKIRHWGKVREIREGSEVFCEFEGERYPGYLDRGNATQFIQDKAKQFCNGKGIDIGAGRWPLPGAVPVQDGRHRNAFRLDEFPDGSLDYVFSSHCLEHLDDWERALKLWIRKLKTGGILFLYLPHESMRLWNPGGPWVGVMHRWAPTHEVINAFLAKHGMDIVDYNRAKDAYWSFHIAARKRP